MKNLAGTWYNELGSKIELVVRNDGTIEGVYEVVPGGVVNIYKAVGAADMSAFEGNRSFGFVVSWNNNYQNQHSITAWSGQYRRIDGEEVLTATWLLTRETRPQDGWASTLVGSDVFKRTPPSISDVNRKQQYAPSAHPVTPVSS